MNHFCVFQKPKIRKKSQLFPLVILAHNAIDRVCEKNLKCDCVLIICGYTCAVCVVELGFLKMTVGIGKKHSK